MQVIPDRAESLTSQVHRVLRQAIVGGELAPGSLHSVAKLADSLRVSRSPVREALISLSDQGMVAFERNRGVRILETTAHDLEEVFSLRLLLEVPAAFRAAQVVTRDETDRLRAVLGSRKAFTSASSVLEHQEMDAAFHRAVMEAAGNRRLTDVVDKLWSHQKTRGLSSAGRARELADVHAEHTAVVDHIAAGDPKGAAAMMRRHIARSASLLLAQEAGGEAAPENPALAWLDVYTGLGGPDGD